jgi:hypothetical protein
MRHRRTPLVLAALMLVALASAPAPCMAAAGSMDAVIPEAPATGSVNATGAPKTSIEQISDSVVAITVGARRVGSGVAIGPNRILTSSSLVATSVLQGGVPAIFTTEGNLLPLSIIIKDDTLGLALLSAVMPAATPVVWGDSTRLISGTKVFALGIPTEERSSVARLPGEVKSSPIASGNQQVITSIPIDPLVEGGALVTPDGKLVGIVVSKGKGLKPGDPGIAVTSKSAEEFVNAYDAKQAAVAAEAATAVIDRWIRRGIMLLGILILSILGWFFRRWYKRMEAREAAKEAEAAASGEIGGPSQV